MPRKDLTRRATKFVALLTGLALLLVQIPASGAARDPKGESSSGAAFEQSSPQARADNWFVLDSKPIRHPRLHAFGPANPISWTPDIEALSRTLKAVPRKVTPVVSVPPTPPSSVESSTLRPQGPVFQSHIPFTSSEITDPTVSPYVLHGQVELAFSAGTGLCSGTVVTSNNSSVVMTAGHCLMDPFTGEVPGTITFRPGYRLGSAPFGEWNAIAFGVTDEWFDSVNAGDADPRYDVGAFVLGPNSSGENIADLLGARGISFNQPPNQLFDSFGYPAAPPFDGERLWLCDSGTSDLLTLVPPPQPHGIGCNMTPGSSGGGWVLPAGHVNSVNSFTLNDHPNVMYGPQFGQSAQDLYDLASNFGGDPVNHRMTVSIKLSGHLVVSGTMKAKDGYKPCTRRAPIHVIKKRASASKKPMGGRVVKKTKTNLKSKFRVNVPDKPGKYYIKSPAGSVDDANTCSSTKSVVKAHKH